MTRFQPRAVVVDAALERGRLNLSRGAALGINVAVRGCDGLRSKTYGFLGALN